MIALEGELDLATSPQLEAACPEAARQARRVVIDLSGLSFIDSTGLRALLSANTSGQREGLELTLIRGPEPVDRVFEVTGTASRFRWSTAI